ncbi:unnamed protein product, partial [Brenthis ino]
MALVAYDNSDSSDYEEDDNETKSTVIVKEEDLTNPVVPNEFIEPQENQRLFNQLPLPSTKKKAVIEEDDEFLHKKEPVADIKPKSKITIPSLSDFKDMEQTVPNSKIKVLNGKKSGLLSILPQPKNAVKSTLKSLVPNAVAQKQATVKRKEPIPSPAKIIKDNTKSLLVTEYSDESDDEIQNDFFSFNKPVELPEDIPLEAEEKVIANAKPEPRSIDSYFKKDADVELQENHLAANVSEHNDISLEETHNTPEPSNDVLDEEAILKLCGARGKRKREEIQIVDVNQQEVLNDAREWLLKGLMDDTTKRQSASKKKGNEPTTQQKRKHQITYLAHQAKANEAELQNQWANNRMTKRQTQSKYGF